MGSSPQPAPSAGEVGAVFTKSLSLYFARFTDYILYPVVVLLPAYFVCSLLGVLTRGSVVGRLQSGDLGAVGTAVGQGLLVVLLTGFIQWAACGLALGAVGKATAAQLEGKTLKLGQTFAALPIGALVATSALFGAAASLGSALLLLPGLAVWFFFCLAPLYTALDGQGAVSAFSRSAAAVLKVPAEVAVVLVVFIVYVLVAAMLVTPLALLGGGVVGSLLSGALVSLAVPWVAVALTLCYDRARQLGA